MSNSADDVRVVTTLGHVDHGKTTFVDYLLAANNIISSRSAGRIRYMDSREDEQERGITMESSAVSLRFKVLGKDTNGESTQKTYIVNLVDTPGHVDFSGEVSSASRLCDGALLLVDVVEGVCTQTISVLRQAWQDRVRPILVLNKCDRLIVELKLAPIEAYHHLSRLIEQVNAVMGSFFAGDRMEDDLRWREERERRLAMRNEAVAAGLVDSNEDIALDMPEEFQEKDDEDIYFSPEKGNVIFASAIDGWGFRTGKFAQLYAAKLGIKEGNLRRVLWGDFFLEPKSKRVIGHRNLKGRNLKPMFVQFILENIWAVYDSVLMNPNSEKVDKIIKTLSLKILPKDMKNKDSRQLLSLIFGQWLSLSTCTIQTVLDIIPPPSKAQQIRIPKFLYPDLVTLTKEPETAIEHALYSCDTSPDAPVVALVSKMFSVFERDLPEKRRKQLTAEELRQAKIGRLDTKTSARVHPYPQSNEEDGSTNRDEAHKDTGESSETTVILGFARLYSGVLHAGSQITCVLPKYNAGLGPTHPHNSDHLLKSKAESLYTMMGRDLEAIQTVTAGNIFAIRGLEGKVWRNATLCAPNATSAVITDHERYLINLGGITRQISPIVRVALEPSEPANLPQLLEGLRLLNQSDPVVETFQQRSGEHVILTAGELHLERCLKDLRERYAKIEIQSSEPIVPFRETAVNLPGAPLTNISGDPLGTVHSSSAFSVVTLTVRAMPMPTRIVSFLRDHVAVVQRIAQDNQRDAETDFTGSEDYISQSEGTLTTMKRNLTSEEFWKAFEECTDGCSNEWKGIADKVWAFGPPATGACMLVDTREDSQMHSLRKRTVPAPTADRQGKERTRLTQDFDGSVETGFQLATLKGPLCAEPVEGIAFLVELLDYNLDLAFTENVHSRLPQVSGSLITAVQEACKSGLLQWSPRLMLAMYSCDIQATTDVLGKVYAVVAKRRGRIISEEIKEGTSFFTVTARLPVVESFGFADEIRKRTSGAASPQLIFIGYEMLDMDPFWVPTTEEELEDLGEKADRENIAKVYMDKVRERKGMFVDRKIVEFAEKQRTLKK